MITESDLNKLFGWKPNESDELVRIRGAALQLARLIVKATVAERRQTVAINLLQEAMKVANGTIHAEEEPCKGKGTSSEGIRKTYENYSQDKIYMESAPSAPPDDNMACGCDEPEDQEEMFLIVTSRGVFVLQIRDAESAIQTRNLLGLPTRKLAEEIRDAMENGGVLHLPPGTELFRIP